MPTTPLIEVMLRIDPPSSCRSTGEGAMDHSHYSKVFGLALAAAFGLMLALNALALSAAPKSDGSVRQPIEASSAPALMGAR